MRKILIIDDNEDVRENTADLLELSNYQVATSPDGFIGIQKARDFNPDLIICDIMMPELDGYGVLRVLGKLPETAGIPFIFLTAKSEKEDFRKGMSMGADDYLTKPFEPKELVLRINSILRRVPAELPDNDPPKTLHMGDARYDLSRGELWRGNDIVRLTATETTLMRIFSASPHTPVSRAKLVEELGRSDSKSQERAVDVQITRLRRKIEADPKNPRYLQTVRGAGYMLAPD